MFDKIENLHDLFEVKLQGLYDAEKQLTKALPKMAAKATDSRLRMGFEKHLRETETHMQRLEQIASSLKLDLNGPDCVAMEGLVKEGEQMMHLRATDDVMDAALISAAQGVEHYEISQYGTAVHFAKRLGYMSEAEMLNQTLTEEKNTDEMLNQLAINSVDEKALAQF
jgi:ferritin-like metal-binding protein YciE